MSGPPIIDLPTLPTPALQRVENDTPYPHLAFDKMGKGRVFYDVVVCKATFVIGPRGGVLPGDLQQPVVLADRYWNADAAQFSSLAQAGDAVLYKPGTDVLVTGTARTHDGRPRSDWLAGIGVSRDGQPVLRHTMRLRGERIWMHRLVGGWALQAVRPTDRVPLRHELAYGGRYRSGAPGSSEEWTVHEPNPCGRGYWDAGQIDRERLVYAPQIEAPSLPVTRIGPADYPVMAPAPLARFWWDRLRYGGTYDEVWLRQFERSAIPDYPADFDLRYFQCAHPALIAPGHLRGDEDLTLVGMMPGADEVWIGALPGIGIEATLLSADHRVTRRAMVLDTVHLDLDAATLCLTWRMTLDQRFCVEAAHLAVRRLAR